MDDFFAGASSAVLKKVHRQRLLAFGVALVIFTWALWVLVRVLWMVTPYTPRRRFIVDMLSISQWALFDARSGCKVSRCFCCPSDYWCPRRASVISNGEFVANPSNALATVAAHGLVGVCLGLYAWLILAADEGGQAAKDSGALGGLAAAGAACSAWSAVSFLRERRHHLRFGLPSGAAIGSHLLAEAGDSLKEGVYSGVVLAAGYLVLRFVSDIFPGSLVGRALAPLLGLPAHIATASAMSSAAQVGTTAGKLTVTYLILLSTTANFALHGFLTKIMNFIIVAPQDFLRLWQASIAALSEQGGARSSGGVPSSPAAMLLDSLSIGHETVLGPAERDFLQARGLSVDSPHARGKLPRGSNGDRWRTGRRRWSCRGAPSRSPAWSPRARRGGAARTERRPPREASWFPSGRRWRRRRLCSRSRSRLRETRTFAGLCTRSTSRSRSCARCASSWTRRASCCRFRRSEIAKLTRRVPWGAKGEGTSDGWWRVWPRLPLSLRAKPDGDG
ncbi:unnamed protein product [Scytosiphon promiscuus]